jgi:hypothetical protein
MVNFGRHRYLKDTKNEFNKYLHKSETSFIFKNIQTDGKNNKLGHLPSQGILRFSMTIFNEA